MDPAFWTERWNNSDIGFHQKSVHDLLVKYWPQMHVPSGAAVLVPLSGKSLDMVWLASEGHEVFGIELSELAVDAFFAERGLAPAAVHVDAGVLKMGGPYSLLCGDFFKTTPEQTAHVGAVYDRAALVALPPAMRGDYAHHLMSLVKPGTGTLLISLGYDSGQMDGPPFAVARDEVEALYRPYGTVEVMEEREVIGTHPHFKARGVTSLIETAYRLERR